MKNNNKHIQEEPQVLRTIILEMIHYWYIFAGFLILFMALTYLYNKYTAPIYNVGLKLLISTSENNRNRNMKPDDFLQGFSLVQQSKDIENEMVILQSLPLIRKTIEDLNLKVSYYYKENYVPFRYWPFRNYPYLILREMYGDAPFEIVLNEKHAQPVGVYFYINIINDKEYSISINAKDVDIYDFQKDMVIDNPDKFLLNVKAKFGDTIQGPDYSFRVLLNSRYNKEFDNKDLYFSFQNINNLSRIYQSGLVVEQSALEATVVDVFFKGPNIKKTQDFLNKLASNYIQRDLIKKSYLAETTIDYIDKELSNISSSLNLAEGQLQYFKKQHQVMDIDQKTLQISQYIQTLENQKNDMLQNLRFYKELFKYFEENKDSPNMLAPSSMGVNDPVLNTMIQQLANYNAERNTMEEKNLQRNPRYKTLTAQVRDLRNSIAENIQFYIRSTQSKLDEINANIERYKFQESQLPQTQTQLLGYERKFNLNNEIYNFLLQKRAEAQIAKASILPDSEIIEKAHYQGISSPKAIFNYAFAIFLAFFFPGSFLFIKFLLNDKISGIDDIKSLTTIPILGKILHNNDKSNSVFTIFPSSPVAESFRSVRTGLNFLLKGQQKQVILITSSTEQEGKTFISFNLAVSLSLLNKKVILLGFDLRKSGNMDKLFNNESKPGLSNYLIDNAAVKDYIHQTSVKNLDVIFSGTPSPNPAELIESDKNPELFKFLKLKYDYIIIDTPPIGPVADAYLLMKHSDIVLYIIRQNFTTKKTLKYYLEEFEQNEFRNRYIVLNDIRPDKRYGYTHTYSYHTVPDKKSFWRRKLIVKK